MSAQRSELSTQPQADDGVDRTHEPAGADTRLAPDVARVLALQRTAGNRAVAALLARQPLPPPGDDDLFAERQRILDWMSAHDRSDPQWAAMEARANAIDAAARRDEGLHTGGFTATSAINAYDANVRITQYVDPVKQLAQRVLDDYEAGKLTHLEAREAAAAGRNTQLAEVRSRLSPGGRAFSEAIKEEGLTLEQLATKYATKVVSADPAKWGLAAEEIGDAARLAKALEAAKGSVEVSEQIIKAAGRTGTAVTVVARVGRVAGPVGMAAGIAISGYEIYTAAPEDQLYVAGREASGFAGGLLGATAGGLAAGWVASLACGPGAPVCAIVVSIGIVGASGYAGGRVGEAGFEWWSEEGIGQVADVFGGIAAPVLVPFAFPITPFAAGGGIGGLMERDRRRAFTPGN